MSSQSYASLDDYYPSIIRLLDVQAIGPYLVKRGVLSSHEYYDSFVGPLAKGQTNNYKLSIKLAKKCLKKPKEFQEALEESLSHTEHINHQELLELLPDKVTGLPKLTSYRSAGLSNKLSKSQSMDHTDGETSSSKLTQLQKGESLHSISPDGTITATIQEETQDLLSKLEVEGFKEINKSPAKNAEKLQSEYNGRNEVLKEMLDKMHEENKILIQQVILAKVEASTLNEKLVAKVESEGALRAAKDKLEESLQGMQTKHESLAVQLESTSVKLESKLEKIEGIEMENKELHEQVNELTAKMLQQQTQLQDQLETHQKELEKDQQKLQELQYQIQEKDKNISNLEGKLETTSLNFKQLQESVATLNEKRAIKSQSIRRPRINKSIINAYGEDCTREDLMEIIEVHVDQIEALHQQTYMYKKEIVKLQQKLKCIL